MKDELPDISSALDVAEEFLHCCRNGERPCIDEFASLTPHNGMRSILYGVQILEGLRPSDGAPGNASTGVNFSGDETAALPEGTVRALATGTIALPATFGRYRLDQLLGEGAMGTVFLAWDSTLNRSVAIKIPRLERFDSATTDRFLREARAMASVDSPHLCTVYDSGSIGGIHFISMEYVEGRTLASLLDEGTCFSDEQVVEMLGAIALAVQSAHDAGVIHRDLKPANIMIRENGEPVLMDFGLARLDTANSPELTTSGTLVGSPAYMAPEQVVGDQSLIGVATDVYALGVVLYEVLCGRRPFDGSTYEVMKQIEQTPPTHPSRIRAGVSSRLETVCLRAIQKRTTDRYASAADFADVLQDSTGTERPTRRLLKALARGRVATACVLLGAAMLLWAVLAPGSTSPARQVRFVAHGDSMAERARSVALGDLDGDGDLDAFLVRYHDKLKVALNDGKGKFSEGPPVADPDTWRNWDVVLGDVERDGDLDAFVTKNGADRLWLNDGQARFSISDMDFGSAESNQPAFADVDADNDLDIVVAQKGQCLVWFNDGKGTFTDSGQRFNSRYYGGCAVGDLDGDGDLDVFLGSIYSEPSEVWFNAGRGRFEDSGQALGGLSTWHVKLCDWDGDGDLDAFAANDDGPLEVWANDGEGHFKLAQRAPIFRPTHGVCVVDVDGDADLDVVATANHRTTATNIVWLSNGKQLFAQQIGLGSMRNDQCAVGDLDGDHEVDIFGVQSWLKR